jgi:putative Mg2+ transporter-C (MgtC) family protein
MEALFYEYREVLLRLFVALAIGGAIGIERTFHGRPAGFRTHALVCMSSAMLMLVTAFHVRFLPDVPIDTLRTDPTRMAQGIMTGIGFLGAGVIAKEGLSIRGLTTAGSIWITAAIGILVGIGFYFGAVVSAVLTIGVLSAFRWLERKMPTEFYAMHTIKFRRDAVMPESALREVMGAQGFSVSNMGYKLNGDGQVFEYRMVIKTRDAANASRLSEALRVMPAILEFRIAPMSD